MAGLARRSLATITTFGLLAALGFTLGALAGILWEQPRMILSYLGGGSTEIAWGGEGPPPADEGESMPDVAAAPESLAPLAISPQSPARPAELDKPRPEPAKPAPAPAPPVRVEQPAAGRASSAAPRAPAAPKPAPAAAPSRAAKSAPVAPVPAVSGRFAIQVGAFAKSEAAEALAQRLEGHGYDAYVTPGAGQGNARWRVRVGPVADKSSAESLAAKLKKNEKLPTWILDEGGG